MSLQIAAPDDDLPEMAEMEAAEMEALVTVQPEAPSKTILGKSSETLAL